MLGIGITTYNRLDRLKATLHAIRQFTKSEYCLIVADDGSTDGTAEWLGASDMPAICGVNRGVAWNKNRCIFYLHELRRCSVIILLEDDCSPTTDGWERPWAEAAWLYGHANIAGPWFGQYFEAGGSGTPKNPFVSSHTSAQCSVFSAEALNTVGYMDTRFGRYGFEHADHTKRMLKAGFGGVKGNTDPDDRNYLIAADGLFVDCLNAPVDFEALRANGEIYERLKNDPIFRPAWQNEDEAAWLSAEMQQIERVK